MSKTEHHVMHVLNNLHTDIHTQTACIDKGQWYCSSSTLPDHILESESVFIVCSVPLSSSSWAISSVYHFRIFLQLTLSLISLCLAVLLTTSLFLPTTSDCSSLAGWPPWPAPPPPVSTSYSPFLLLPRDPISLCLHHTRSLCQSGHLLIMLCLQLREEFFTAGLSRGLPLIAGARAGGL